MKHPLPVTLSALAVLALAPGLRAEEPAKEAPKPAMAPKPEGERAKDPAADDLRKKFMEVRKQASEDPSVKPALDAAKTAMTEASSKLYAKMLEIDPSLAPMIDREKSRMTAGGEGGRREKKPDAAKSDAPKEGGAAH